MGYLLLAVICSAMISITMRLSAGKVKSQFIMLAANYFVCALLGGIYSDFSLISAGQGGLGLTVGFAVINGVILLAGLVLLQISTRKNGVVLSSIFMPWPLSIREMQSSREAAYFRHHSAEPTV